jgi:O-antigen ligase
MFAWVEVFLGIAVLLIILKKHRLLAIWFLAAAFACFIIFDLNVDIIPRLSDVEVTIRIRLKIWDVAIKNIKKAPFFGHGFMSYLFLKQSYYQKKIIPHSHSLYLEILQNFGIVGTAILIRYSYQYYKSVIKLCFKANEKLITSLILSVTLAALAHGITDITLMWIQTLPLFLIILSGYGVYEKMEQES